MTARPWWVRWPILVFASVTVLAGTRLPAQESSATTKQRAAESRLKNDITYLASDKLEGRGVRTSGINMAADHVASEFKKAGLKPGGEKGTYFQPFSMNLGSSKLVGQNTVRLHGPKGQELELELGKQFQVAGLTGSGKITAPVVFVGYGITLPKNGYDDYKLVDVAGKVVIVLRQLPRADKPDAAFKSGANSQHGALTTKLSNAKLHKAAAVIFVNNLGTAKNDDALMPFNYTAWNQQSKSMPVVQVQRSVIDTLLQSNLKKSLREVEEDIDRTLQPQSRVLADWTASLEVQVQQEKQTVKNVVGVLEGSGPLADETVVIGAHYDHLGLGGRGSGSKDKKDNKVAIYHGADDNGSGTTVLLELARRLGGSPNLQGRRLVFMAFTAEESGLIGSQHYCKHPLFPLEKTVAMVNLDMVGRLTQDKETSKDKLMVYGVGTSKNFETLITTLNKKHDFKLQIVRDIYLPGSDHSPFYNKKIAILGFFTGFHPDYHRTSDTSDKINVTGMRRVADIVEEVVNYLHEAQERPQYIYVKWSRPAGKRSDGAGPRLGIVPNYQDDKEGLLISEVTKNGPASKVGLRAGDRIVAIDGKPVKNLQAYMVMMRSHKKGDALEVEFMRDGKKQTVKLKLD